MPSDIRLEENTVVVEGNWMHARTWDFMLDAPDRRGQRNTEGLRRALVHNRNDGLTINYENDYPGGVVIESEVWLDGVLQVAFSSDLYIRLFDEDVSEFLHITERNEILKEIGTSGGAPGVVSLRAMVEKLIDLELRVRELEDPSYVWRPPFDR